jgi:hypothetical protein
MPRLPSFFLIGAAKAGTTSLHAYLGQHPEIYVSPIKEPSFFADEVRVANIDPVLRARFAAGQRATSRYLAGGSSRFQQAAVCDWPSYEKLFAGVNGHKAAGESSVIYLWSPTAARNVAARIPHARILAILRDPAERAYSQYLDNLTAGHVRHTFGEHIDRGRRASREFLSIEHPFLDFGNYATQWERYLRVFPREQLHVILYEDFQRDPMGVLRAVFGFLGVDPAAAIDLSKRYNQPLVPRFRAAGYFLKRAGIWQRGRRMIPQPIARLLRPLALAPRAALEMETADRQWLVAHYREEVLRLQDLLQRDLSSWTR